MGCYTLDVIVSWRMTAFLCGLLIAAANAAGQSGVVIEVDQFGVGNAFRAGDLTAVRLKLTSNLAQPTPVWVQWEVANGDGDICEHGRSLTLTPNVPALVWLYAPLPPDANPASVWAIRVFEERDGERRAEVGGARINPTGALGVDPGASMIAVVGQPTARLGLEGYTSQAGTQSRPVASHENTFIAFGIRPSQLPDRWYGYLPYEALAWGGDADPKELGIDQAEAIREWVRRGGHLIISLPSAGNPWGLGVDGQTDLEELLPCRTPGAVPRKDDAVPLADLVPVISKHLSVAPLVGLRKPPEFSIRVFKELNRGEGGLNVIDNHFEPLIAMPDGRVIAIQRYFGFGRVTVIGLDLADGRLTGLSLPQPDAFWNRVLGRRVDTPTGSEIAALEKDQKLSRAHLNFENALGSGSLITSMINMEGQAGKGLLLALMLFIAYWLLAGPIGFFLLKNYGQVKHSWLAFAACAGLFTAVAWGGVTLFPKRIEISHVTFLDHIARPPDDPRADEPQYQRATSFFSAYVPQYGATSFALDSQQDQRDVMFSWSPPGVASQKFPNVDRYRVDVAKGFSRFSMPARSTATQLYAQWLGGLDPNWGGTLLVDPKNPIRVIGASTEQALEGNIINQLPGALTNVTVIWVKNARTSRRRYAVDANGNEQRYVTSLSSGTASNVTVMWRLKADPVWESGGTTNLAALPPSTIMETNIKNRYIDAYSDRNVVAGTGLSMNDNNRRDYLEMLSFFQQLNPPQYIKAQDSDVLNTSVAFHRELGRELDLSPWFSRPCLIIIGFLEGAPSPVPLSIDDESNLPVSGSRTIVRWVYPLPLDEKFAFPEAFEEEEPE
jgi:hypothetical protein